MAHCYTCGKDFSRNDALTRHKKNSCSLSPTVRVKRDGSQVIRHCLDDQTYEEIGDKVRTLVFNEIEGVFLSGRGQPEIDDGAQPKINENGNNSSQVEEVFGGTSRCEIEEVSSISLPCTTPKNTVIANKNDHLKAPSKKRKATESPELATSNVEPKLKKRLFHESFPADKEFSKCERSMNFPNEIMKWRNVPLNTIYHVLSIEITGSNGDPYIHPYIATMKSKSGNIFKVWIRERIYDRLKNYDMEKKCVYIRSYGLKPCRGDPSKQYFDFSIIVKEQ